MQISYCMNDEYLVRTFKCSLTLHRAINLLFSLLSFEVFWKNMVFRLLFTVGISSLILLTETTADSSKLTPIEKHIFYSWRPAYWDHRNATAKNDSQSESIEMNHKDENRNSTSLFTDDHSQCQIKEIIECDPSYPYQTINGSCNNLNHPTWGISEGCYLRFQPAFYDGFGNLRKSITGDPLPEPRELVLNIFKDVTQPSTNVSLMFTVYGQTIAHDLSRAKVLELDTECCNREEDHREVCSPISIRPDDPFYSNFNLTCLFMHRTTMCKDCSSKKREQVNGVTSSLDASILYGTDENKAMLMRANDGTGKMKSNVTKNGELLPTDHHAHRLFCPRRKNCFLTGDKRVNQHAFLSTLETLYMREHNRVASELKKMNPHWEEETLYQEARRIVIATLQCITYKEYLPTLLGTYITRRFDLAVRNTTDGTKYNPDIQFGVRNEFANSCFRLHSMIPRDIGSLGLRFKNVYQHPELIINGHLETITRGASKAPSEQFDHYCVEDTTDYLGLFPGRDFGVDLVSIDIQRSRDHGLAPYVTMVRFCSEGLVDIITFDDLAPLLMPKNKVEILKEHYRAVEDVDLYVGMLFEDKYPGSEVGPTAACIITRQFYFSKYGDRFYFEHEGEVPSFTEAQRNSIKQCSLSRLLCDNSNITSVQKFSMLLPSPKNPDVDCEDIPEIDLSPWKNIL